jgi:hypothetical protein
MADDDRSRGAGDPDHVVVLGQPEAAIPKPLDMTCKVERIAQRVGRRGAFRHKGEVENGEGGHSGPGERISLQIGPQPRRCKPEPRAVRQAQKLAPSPHNSRTHPRSQGRNDVVARIGFTAATWFSN